MPDRIVLIGFMGAGKSTVGPILAARLGYDWVDTDEVIQERAGAPVTAIFRERGEAGFRALEAAVLADLASRTGIVVATGGGAAAQDRNRDFFTRGARVFHLRVSLSSVRQRTGADSGRPLLSRSESEVQQLYDERARIYESLGTAVETDDRSPEAVAQQIISLLASPMASHSAGDTG
jgi:shikimate kinase